MIHHAETALPPVLEADIAIAGGGPAGIVLALELAEQGHRVCLLEGGGTDEPGTAADCYEGTQSGRPYGLAGSRLRWLGGSSNHWGGWVRPLDGVDFVDKPHFPLPAWPFGEDTLQPWYARAAHWCEVPGTDYDPDVIALLERSSLLPLGEQGSFRHEIFRFSPPTRFGQRYADALARSEHVDCWLQLNAVGLVQSDSTVRTLRAVTVNGEHTEVRAKFYVLALGGLENARFLLNQDVVPGNQSDFVGRCFMDHFGLTPGALLTSADLHYERGHLPGDDSMTVVTPHPDLIVNEGLRNACMVLNPKSPDPLLPPSYLHSPLFPQNEGDAMTYRCVMVNEPLPHPESRVTLGTEFDRLGQRRLHLHWHLPPEDFAAPLAMFQRWALELGATGLGRARRLVTEAPPDDQQTGIGYHHMGTTRMAASPDYGVVDADCRCWDHDNLFIAGSSVFPTAGFSNPTLTIVALAARLAGHLDWQLQAT